ncbi:D-2-hydroxyacid dehydrogenase [Shewanella cyperi]|uniref:D-2-hydroxyacid dehydrogenase n=1 Tax=Shewanella cyperi TaxID=2814292 RepID=A0A974XNX6_9GAMM|nr:D-2-hydroxyacid dehydrogenase [Shewanella cyperi]QSX30698.1 D-2-hydroxyacid dehydrogenase [Shewanella cyperi]QSX41476.1 D-2-hydroxyacid dehydrogenase [Shewanella cyperi]
MRLCVLDGYTLNPGDLDWSPLAAICDLQLYDRSAPEEVLSRALGAPMLLTNKTVLNGDTLRQLPGLKYIGVLATGTNVVDMEAAKALGIAVTNVPAYGPDAVAQMVFAHILHHVSHLAEHHSAVVAGEWSRSPDFCFTLSQLRSLKGMRLGIVGFGTIGRQVARIGAAFDMELLISSRSRPRDLPNGAKWLPLQELLPCADIISLHCPLTPDTRHLINEQTLALMKPGCLLVNTARGDLVDEVALAGALNAGKLQAAVDVLSSEPPRPDNPLLHAANISISPHIAWATLEARQNLMNIAVANVAAFLRGERSNRLV